MSILARPTLVAPCAADHGWLPDGPQASGRVVNGYPMKKVLAG